MEDQNNQNLLFYFENIASRGLHHISNEFEKYIFSIYGVINPKHNWKKGFIEYSVFIDGKEKVEVIEYLRDFTKRVFDSKKKEFLFQLDQILLNPATHQSSASRILELYLFKIQELINDYPKNIQSVPNLKETLESLVHKINFIYNSKEEDPFILKYPNIQIPNESELIVTPINDQALVLSIFGFMRDINHSREQIMVNIEFQIMIKYINEFIETQNLPNIKTKVEPNITNELLRFCFWVLHKELYGTRRIKDNFFDFMLSLFENFKDISKETLKKKFAVSTAIKKDKFIPDSVTKYIK